MQSRVLLFAVALIAGLVATGPRAGADARAPRYDAAEQTPAGATPHFPGFDPVTGHVLVSNVTAATVTEVVPGGAVVRTFSVGAQPHTVVVDGPSRRAYVANMGSSSVSVLDLTTGGVTATISTGGLPHGLTLDAGRGRLYVTSRALDRLEVYDLGTHEQIGTVPVGDDPWGVAARDRCVAVTATGGSTLHLVDADTLQPRRVVEVGAKPWNVRISPNCTFYVTLEGAGEVVAVRKGKVVWRTPVGTAPHGLAVDPGRNAVLAAVTGSNRIVVLNADTGRLLQELPSPAGPAGMTLDESSGRAFVGAQGAGLVVTVTPRR